MSKPFSTRSLIFGGTDEYATMGNVLGFERTDAFSISCWVRATLSLDAYLVSKVSASPFTGYGLNMDSTGYVQFFVANALATNAAHVRTTGTGWDDGNWHHIVATYDGSSSASGIHIYVDGADESLSTLENTLSASAVTTDSFNLGARTNGSVLLAGSLDEVAVFDRDLTAKEVRQLFNLGGPPDLSLLSFSDRMAGWWRMGDGDTLPTLTDHGYGGNDGTTVNMDSTNVVADASTSRRNLVFDGSNEYVKMGNASVLSFERTDPFSISCWFLANSSADGYMVTKMSSGLTGYGFSIQSGGNLSVYILNTNTTNGINVDTTSTWGDSQWHHAVMTYDGSSSASGVTVYVDGQLQGLSTLQDNLSATIVNSAESNLASRTNGSILYEGRLTQVSVWDVELTARDVAALYNLGGPPDVRDLFNRLPVGYWPCDRPFLDGVGAIVGVPDLSGNANHGIPVNMEGSDVALGHPLSALEDEVPARPHSQLSGLFGGTDEYVTMGNVLGFERTDAFSISCWVKTTLSAISHIVGKTDNSTAAPSYALLIDASGKPYFDLISTFTGSNYLQVGATAATVNDGRWHHLCLTYSGSSAASGVTILIDGVAVPTTTYSDTLTTSVLSTAPLTIGRRAAHPSNTYPYIGNLDEVSIFDKELSSEEVWVLYNKGAPCDLSSVSFAANLVGWWRMGDGDTYPTLTDNSSSGNDGTMTNMEATDIVADVPTGKFSLVFGGSNEYVTMGNVLDKEYTDAFSISCWVKYSSGATDGYLVSKINSSVRGYGFIARTATGYIRFNLLSSSTTGIRIDTTNTFNDGVWHHAVVTYNGNGLASGVVIYVDGSPETTTTDIDNLAGASVSNTASFNLGARTDGASTFHIGGLSKVAFYDRELTADEVLEVYNEGNPTDLRKMSSGANLVGYWPCGNGDLYPYVEDLSGNGYTGTMTNMEVTDFVNDSAFKRILTGVPLLPRVSGQSVAFGGTGEYVSVGNVLGFERTDAFSVSIWAKWVGSTYYVLLGKQQSTPERGYTIAVTTSGQVEVGILNTWNTNLIYLRTVERFNNGEWHHVVVTYDGSSTAAGTLVYVDNQVRAKTVDYDSLSATILTTAELRLGARDSGSPDYFVGSLDEVAVYNVELTAADVSRIHNGGTPPDLSKLSTSANLVGWWKMGDGDTYPTLQDSSVSGNDGTMTNMASTDIVHNDVPLAGASIVFSQSGTDKDLSQITVLTTGTLVTLKDAKGYGARAWNWAFTAFPGPDPAPPTITNSEAQQASFTPTTDGFYIVGLTRMDHDGVETTDTQAFMVLDSEGHTLPTAKVNGLINSSEEALTASWFGRADASTNVAFDAYLRWLKTALKASQSIQIVSGRQSKATSTFEGIGGVRLDFYDFPTPSTATFEVVLEASSGYTAQVRLYNLTDGTVVLGSVLSTTNTSSTALSGTITMPSGRKDYEVQLRVTAGGGFATCTGARIILR